jgi:hypothetical protein
VIRVREAVRLLARGRDDCSLLEREHGLGGAGEREQRLDSLPALGIRRRVGVALHDAQYDLVGGRDVAEERRGGVRGGPELEMRGAVDRERAASEERAPQVRAAAAGSGDDTAGRALEWPVARVEDACRDENV